MILVRTPAQARAVLQELDESGLELIAYVMTTLDVVAARELADAVERVQQLNAKLVGLQEEKDEIFAMAVHDMKSPLSGIYGMASLMVDGTINDPAEHTQVGQDIRTLSERMLLMINDLVEIYRLESGEIEFQPLEVMPADVVSLLTSAHHATARRKHINLEFRHSSDVESILVDPPSVERLGGNLISNAIKYSPPGTTVTIELTVAEGQLRLAVSDEGPGISAADQKKLFRKFSRLSARPTGGESSSGLGLAIVKQLVEALQGSVSCESTLGAGATFRVAIPVGLPTA